LVLAGCDRFSSADDRRARAERLLDTGAFSEALIELKNAESAAPGDWHILLLTAQAHRQIGDLEGAAKELDKAQAAGAEAAALERARADLLLAKSDFPGLLAMASDAQAKLPPDAARVLRAQALVGLGRCTEAIPLARAALEADPALADARLALASCYTRNGLTTRALRELELHAEDDDPVVLLARGKLERLAGKPTQAAATWQKAVQAAGGKLDNGQRLLLLTSIADLQIESDDLAGLRETHRRMLAIAPEAQLTVLLAARAELMEGKVDSAVNTLRNLATAAPELTVVHATLASAYVRQRSWEQARREAGWLDSKPGAGKPQDLEKQVGVVANAPADTEQYWLLAAGLHLALGQLDAVHDALRKAAAVAPKSFGVQVAQARMALQTGDTARALQLSSDLTKANPEDVAARLLHADALQAVERFGDAAQVFDSLYQQQPSAALAIAAHRARTRASMPDANVPLEQWLSRNPGDLAIRAAYAEGLRKAGDNGKAIREYEAIVAVAPQSAPALNNLAWLYHLAGDKRAVDTAKKAWQAAPKSPDVQDTYGWLLVETGSVEEGVAMLAQADGQIGLTQPEVRVHYVTGLKRQGKTEEAKLRLRELKAETPDFPAQSDAARLLESAGELGAT
jgi:tetratricopeptide (TPR) repeat protein